LRFEANRNDAHNDEARRVFSKWSNKKKLDIKKMKTLNIREGRETKAGQMKRRRDNESQG